jgi:hypothetical protein
MTNMTQNYIDKTHVTVKSVGECAKICSSESKFKCLSFDYCYIDAANPICSTSGQSTGVGDAVVTAKCDHYRCMNIELIYFYYIILIY